jgi:hypothetical protein
MVRAPVITAKAGSMENVRTAVQIGLGKTKTPHLQHNQSTGLEARLKW